MSSTFSNIVFLKKRSPFKKTSVLLNRADCNFHSTKPLWVKVTVTGQAKSNYWFKKNWRITLSAWGTCVPATVLVTHCDQPSAWNVVSPEAEVTALCEALTGADKAKQSTQPLYHKTTTTQWPLFFNSSAFLCFLFPLFFLTASVSGWYWDE